VLWTNDASLNSLTLHRDLYADALPIRNTLVGAGAYGSAATFGTHRLEFGGARPQRTSLQPRPFGQAGARGANRGDGVLARPIWLHNVSNERRMRAKSGVKLNLQR
jgi:hypothetical protein